MFIAQVIVVAVSFFSFRFIYSFVNVDLEMNAYRMEASNKNIFENTLAKYTELSQNSLVKEKQACFLVGSLASDVYVFACKTHGKYYSK